MDQKWCAKCNQWKSRTEFHTNRRRADELTAYCKDCNNATHRAYYAAKRTDRLEWQRQYRRANKVRFAESERKRWLRKEHCSRARDVGLVECFTIEEWDALCAHYEYHCLACGEQKPLTVDHVVPLSRGGSNTICNIQPLCRSCNGRKRNRIIDYRSTEAVAA